MTTVISGDTGVSQVQAGSINQDDLAANVVGKGPAFSVYQSVAQSVANATFTKVLLQSEEFDTSSAFDSTTNYRFQPTVAGYYSFFGGIAYTGTITGNRACLYKNGSVYKTGNSGDLQFCRVSGVVYLNGISDYVELWCYHSNGGSVNTAAFSDGVYLQGYLARAA